MEGNDKSEALQNIYFVGVVRVVEMHEQRQEEIATILKEANIKDRLPPPYAASLAGRFKIMKSYLPNAGDVIGARLDNSNCSRETQYQVGKIYELVIQKDEYGFQAGRRCSYESLRKFLPELRKEESFVRPEYQALIDECLRKGQWEMNLADQSFGCKAIADPAVLQLYKNMKAKE
jgi:hypothetical protein